MHPGFSRWKQILIIAWPLIIANSFWNLQLTIDRIYLGMHSTESLGAAMAVMGVFWVPMALLQGTANYVMTFVAQYYGAGEKEKIGACVWQSLYISFAGGIAFLSLIFLAPAFFAWVNHPSATRVLEVEYFNSLTWSALPTALVAAVSGFYTGLGRTRLVIGINFVGLVLNAALDYVMIFGKFGFPALGAAGAGYATAIATAGAAMFGLFLLFRREHETVYRIYSDWKPNFRLLKQFLRFGLPSGLQWALEGLAFTVFLVIMGNLPNGEAVLASSSITVTVMMLSVLPSLGIAQAVMTIVGQKLGEGAPGSAEEATWDGVKIACCYAALMSLTFLLFPDFYLSWFKNEANAKLWTQVTALAPDLLRILAIFTVLDTIYLNLSFALKGAGDTRFVSLVALTVPWPMMVLPAFLLRSVPHAAQWSWGFVAIYSLAVTGVIFIRFRGGKWKSMSVIHPGGA
ncbi:MAG: MATE family efflux transporter [Planctomycetes bacterium]|nr:MATE family efflux transporter [Planctomycetota bacterium]